MDPAETSRRGAGTGTKFERIGGRDLIDIPGVRVRHVYCFEPSSPFLNMPSYPLSCGLLTAGRAAAFSGGVRIAALSLREGVSMSPIKAL